MNPLIIALLVMAGATFSGSVKIIKEGEEALVEMLGSYDGKKLKPGLNFITPLISYIAVKETIREKILKIPPQNCITSDNVSIKVDAVVYWRILDLEKAYYKVQNLEEAVSNLVLTQLRTEMGRLSLNQTLTARTEVNENLLRDLDISTAPWGVKVMRVELLDIVPSSTVQGAMELQMSAERKKNAAILISEGERQAMINNAQGESEALLIEAQAKQKVSLLNAESQHQEQILRAKSVAEALDFIAEKLQQDSEFDGSSYSTALQFLLAQDYLEMGMNIGRSDNSKVLFVDPKNVPETVHNLKSMIDSSKVNHNGNGNGNGNGNAKNSVPIVL